MTFAFLVCAFSVCVLSCLPGYLIAGLFKSLDRDERIACAPALSFFIIGSLAFIRFLLDLPFVFYVIVLSVVILLPLVFAQRSNRSWKHWSVALLVLFFSHLFILEVLTPAQGGAGWYGDWWEHYDRSLVYLGGRDVTTLRWFEYNVAARTPLFHLNSAFFLALFGKHFWVFQIVSVFQNTCFILSVFVLLHRFFDRRIAPIVLFFLMFNPWLINNALYTWPKLSTTYCVLLGLYFYLKFRESLTNSDLFWSVFFAAVGSMLHQMAVIYAFFFLADLAILLLSKRWHPTRAFFGIVSGVLMTVVAPWYVWASARLGIREVLLGVPTATKLPSWGFFDHLCGTLYNMSFSVMPAHLLTKRFLIERQATFEDPLLFYFNPLSGAMTITLLFAVMVASIRRRKELVAAVCRWHGQWFFLFIGVMAVILGSSTPQVSTNVFLSFVGVFGFLVVLLCQLPGYRSNLPGNSALYSIWRNPVFFVGVFSVWGYLGGILAHIHTPYQDLGVVQAGAVPSVLLTIAGAVYFLRRIPRHFMIIVFLGVLTEFVVITWFKWLTLERYLAKGIVDYWGANWDLKVNHHLEFARDGLSMDLLGWWVGFGILLEFILAGLAYREIVRQH